MFVKENPNRIKIINHHLDCNNKCLIYLLFFKVWGLQYLGSTTDKFRFRWSNYKENDTKALRGEEYMQSELFEYFPADNHNCFLNGMIVVLHRMIVVLHTIILWYF